VGADVRENESEETEGVEERDTGEGPSDGDRGKELSDGDRGKELSDGDRGKELSDGDIAGDDDSFIGARSKGDGDLGAASPTEAGCPRSGIKDPLEGASRPIREQSSLDSRLVVITSENILSARASSSLARSMA
jgi:hypothetical protein